MIARLARRCLVPALSGILVALAAGSASATPISGTGSLGSFTGDLTYTPIDSSTGTLTISLTNSSPMFNSGFITAFVFNNPGDSISNVTEGSFPTNFDVIGGPSFNNSINGAPFGDFDIGASISNQFEGGGNPSQGLAVGATGIFVFNLTGSGMLGLTDNSFLTAMSQGQQSQAFVVRFRGFNNGGSNKVPLDDSTDGTDGILDNDNDSADSSVIPEPVSLALWGALGLGIAVCGLRRKLTSRRGQAG